MPSPVGHSLIGAAIGAAYYLPAGTWSQMAQAALLKRRYLAACVIIANLPDVDYVPGLLTGDLNAYHHHFTHTLGWILLAAAGLWIALRAMKRTAGWREAALIVALLASHLAADWFTEDHSVPFGIMAFWPFSGRFTLAQAPIFWHLRKQDWADMAQIHNFHAVLMELAITLPLLALVLVLKRVQGIPWRQEVVKTRASEL